MIIRDDDSVTIGFEREEYPVREGDEAVSVCARVLLGSLARSVEVLLESRDLSAIGKERERERGDNVT